MYLSHFGLAEAPFSIAPDPRYLYMTRSHQEALAHLLYGVNGDGGFVLLTGEVGAGKTTICRCLLEQIPQSCDVAYIFNPRLTVEELLSTICTELHIAYPAGNTSIKVFVDSINAYLLDANARGRHTVLIIDEAQNLSADVLEQLRLLTNLETNQRKLLQIILLGQPELLRVLERPEMRQLAQRIVARYHLGPLTRNELAAYVQHRLQVSGCERPVFPDAVIGRLFNLSGGIPRVINVLCDRALLGAYVEGKDKVDRATLDKAAAEVFGKPSSPRLGAMRAATVALVLAAGGALAFMAYQRDQDETPGKAAPASAPAQVKQGPPSLATAPAAAPVVAGDPSVAWPAGIARSESRALAFAALFRAWGASYGGGDGCREAEALGLRCRTARGGLDDLRETNRPAILVLSDAQGAEFHGVLARLDSRVASLVIGNETRTVALAALATQWAGYYTVLWRNPPVPGDAIRRGQRGASVAWLEGQLAKWQGRAPAADAELVFDDALAQRVKQFQLAQGLVPDGLVGPQTLMRLSGVGDAAAPKLAAERGEK
jgi:general secretion pathway protein A